jgi:gamma-glutamylcyclotransferase (GGCT)/AIG2-like uncharacterized protein YtfP
MIAQMHPLFVYGSLINDLIYNKVTGSDLNPLKNATLDDYRRARVIGQVDPAMYPDPNHNVTGLLISVTEDGISLLDEFETDDYKRITVAVNGEAVFGYIWNNSYEELEEREWSYDAFVKNDMNKWLQDW